LYPLIFIGPSFKIKSALINVALVLAAAHHWDVELPLFRLKESHYESIGCFTVNYTASAYFSFSLAVIGIVRFLTYSASTRVNQSGQSDLGLIVFVVNCRSCHLFSMPCPDNFIWLLAW